MPQKKKKLGGIINCDLYFSPTGIKNVLISSKIEKIQCSTFNHDLRERTKKGEVIPIIRLRMYQDGDSL